MDQPTASPTIKDRLFTVGLWTLLLGMSWSLPVLGLIENQRERERMESGIYYTPKMPAEWYVQKDHAAR
ncbi:hypothetical protein [Indioceanicola profundi]|uniref:hypothetical protein n=1 Tax=Indioceanicola profundi TaxID=2220096 RepID=UPI000E6ACF77|nr:hypothetical protein [Indioceanicola profundi]